MDPDAQLDLGNGAGEAVQVTLGDSLAETVRIAAARDGVAEGDHTGLIQVRTQSTDSRFNQLAIAPILVAVSDRAIPAIVGTPGDDMLTGDLVNRGDDDLMFGEDGNDTISGRRGNDEIHGDGGDDELFGDAGNDRIFGEDGDDVAWGGRGNDLIDGGPGSDTAYGGAGNDRIFGGDGDDTAWGGRGNDLLDGGGGSNTLLGGPGSDVLVTRLGRDVHMSGGAGNDELVVEFAFDRAGEDQISRLRVDGGAGDDRIRVVSSETEPLVLGPSGDYLFTDRYSGGSGNDEAQLERRFLLTSDDTTADQAHLDVHDDSTVDLGTGHDTLDNTLGVGIDPARSSFDGVHYVTNVVHQLGPGHDLLYDRFEFDAKPGTSGDVATEELTIVHESIVWMGSGNDASHLDDLVAVEPGGIARHTDFAFERTQFGGAGDDDVLDTGALTVDGSGLAPDQHLLTMHRLSHVMQRGDDRVEDQSTIEVSQHGQSDFAAISRLYDGGAGNDTLIVSGSFDFALEHDDSRDGDGGIRFDLTMDGGAGHDSIVFNPNAFTVTNNLPRASDGVRVDLDLLGGRGNDGFEFYTDQLLAGRSSAPSEALAILIDGGSGTDTVTFKGDATVDVDLDSGIAVVAPELADDSIAIALRQIESATVDHFT